MDVANIDPAELEQWLVAALDRSDLASGRVPPFEVKRGNVLSAPNWVQVGRAASPPMVLSNPNGHTTLASFLKTQERAREVVVRVERLLIGDAQVTNGGLAPSYALANRNARLPPTAVIFPPVPNYTNIEWERRHSSWPVFESEALQSDELLFVHAAASPVSYLLEPTVSIDVNGTTAALHLVVLVTRAPNQRPVMTRVHI